MFLFISKNYLSTFLHKDILWKFVSIQGYDDNNGKQIGPYFDMIYILSDYFTCNCQNLKNLSCENGIEKF